MSMPARRLEAVIRGRVQGVGFRHFVWRRATQRGLSGQVRNRSDGSVEVIAEGPEPMLIALLEQLRAGPAAGRVDQVEERWSGPEHDFSSFEIVG